MSIRTASGKEAALVAFYNQLKRDGETATSLARKANVGRAYLTRVLNGRVTGVNTWKHVLPHLSSEALFLLKQCSAWNEERAVTLSMPEVRIGRFNVRTLGQGKIWLMREGEGMEVEESALDESLGKLWRNF